MPKGSPQSPNSVLGKVQLLLEQFTLETPILTLAEITRRSGLAKTSVFRLLTSLGDLGLIYHDEQGYRLSMRFYSLGMVAKQSFHLANFFEGALEPLAHTLNETVIAATLDKHEILYMHVVEPTVPLRVVIGAGQRRDARYGATGLALLSCLSEEARQTFTTTPLPQYTPTTITDPDAWLKRLETIAQTGIAIEHGEYLDGISGIAVPLTTLASLPLTIAVVGPQTRLHTQEETIVRALKQLAQRLMPRLRST